MRRVPVSVDTLVKTGEISRKLYWFNYKIKYEFINEWQRRPIEENAYTVHTNTDRCMVFFLTTWGYQNGSSAEISIMYIFYWLLATGTHALYRCRSHAINFFTSSHISRESYDRIASQMIRLVGHLRKFYYPLVLRTVIWQIIANRSGVHVRSD